MNLMRNVQFVLLALFLILIGNPLYAATESTNIRYGYEKSW